MTLWPFLVAFGLIHLVGANTEISSEDIGQSTRKYTPKLNNNAMSYKHFLTYLRDNDDFLSQFVDTLRTSDFGAYYFECRPYNKETWENEDFEFVLVESTSLQGRRANV